MRIDVCSDVHLEFGNWVPYNTLQADVLVLSGDIMVAADLSLFDEVSCELGTISDRSVMFHRFMQHCAEQYPHVVYVAGNHEHYHGDFAQTMKILKNCFEYLPNVHILDNETFELDNYVFVGGTLWTDMNKQDPYTMYAIRKMMNDFITVKNSNNMVNFRDQEHKFHQRVSTFSPEDAVAEHLTMLQKIDEVYKSLPADKFMIVVGHHAPSPLSTHEKYKDNGTMNGGYNSDLTEFILDRPKIKLWTHGHTHHEFDYMLGGTRVVCNPRGYVLYERDTNDKEPYNPKLVKLG